MFVVELILVCAVLALAFGRSFKYFVAVIVGVAGGGFGWAIVAMIRNGDPAMFTWPAFGWSILFGIVTTCLVVSRS